MKNCKRTEGLRLLKEGGFEQDYLTYAPSDKPFKLKLNMNVVCTKLNKTAQKLVYSLVSVFPTGMFFFLILWFDI